MATLSMPNLLQRFTGWLQPQKRLDPASEQILLNSGIVLPNGAKRAPSARTPAQALRNSAVYSCVKLLSETIASLPLHIVETASKREATTHPLYRVLREPNAEQTGPEFWEMLLGNYFTWGAGYCEVVRRGSRIVELVPFAAGHTEARRANGRVGYVYTIPNTGQQITLGDEQVLAFRMFGFNDSLKAFAPIWIAQRAIELALTQEQTAIENFADGLRPDIIVKLPPEKALEKLGELGPEFLKEESVKIQNQIAGARTRRELYLPFGYDSTPYAANYQQSQFQETRDFQILEFSRVWRVPPSKLGVISKQRNANADPCGLKRDLEKVSDYRRRREEVLGWGGRRGPLSGSDYLPQGVRNEFEAAGWRVGFPSLT